MWLGLHLEGFGDLEQMAQQTRQRDLGNGFSKYRFSDRSAGLSEIIDRFVGRHEACAHMHFGDLFVIARQKAQQHFTQRALRGVVNAAHNAEVHHNNSSFIGHKQIARVHIGVKKAVRENHFKKGFCSRFHHNNRIKACGFNRAAIINPQTRNTLKRQHTFRCALPIDARHLDAGIVCKIFGKLLGGSGLEAKIHLITRRVFEGRHHITRLAGLNPPANTAGRYRV